MIRIGLEAWGGEEGEGQGLGVLFSELNRPPKLNERPQEEGERHKEVLNRPTNRPAGRQARRQAGRHAELGLRKHVHLYDSVTMMTRQGKGEERMTDIYIRSMHRD